MRNYRKRNDTVLRATAIALYYFAILSSQSSAKTVITQKIGFAGGLNESEEIIKEAERSPIFAATSVDYHSSNHHNRENHRIHPLTQEELIENDKLKRIQYNKLPDYGPRSRPEYDLPQKSLYNKSPSPSPYKKLYAVSSTVDYPNHNYNNHDVPQPDPKKYAFAYAVRDGYRDDYSHKESRDGKVTIGEYKVLLPDGRLQVVRYTADALAGFKADVTYEGEETPPKPNTKPATLLLPSKSPYYGQPSSAIHKQYVSPSLPSRSDSSAYVASSIKSHPSLSPSIVYTDSEHHEDDHYILHRSVPHYSEHIANSISTASSPTTPSGPVLYKISPTAYAYNKQVVAPSPTFAAFIKSKLSPTPTISTYYSPTPKNIYEKINAASSLSKEPYSAIPRGLRAGPTPSYNKVPIYKLVSSPTPKSSSILGHGYGQGQRKIIHVSTTPTEPYTKKSRLVPVEFFKAGPIKDGYETHRHGGPLLSSDDETSSRLQHFFLEHDNNYHDDRDHHLEEHYQPNAREYRITPIKSSLATFTANNDYGGGTAKPTLYIKSKPLVPVGRPIRPSVGGLVYLETPGHGPRPNSVGVKELLDRIPHDNLPRPRTTTHPYEIGAKDYGANVSYGISKSNNNEFIPSQEIPQEYLPKLETDRFRHHSTEYHEK